MSKPTTFEEYSTADFRKSMTSAFESARFKDKIVQVKHHGKPWVSIVSPEHAENIQRISLIGHIAVAELASIMESVDGQISVAEFLNKVVESRSRIED